MRGSYLTPAGAIGGAHPAVVRRRVREALILGATGLVVLAVALAIAMRVSNPSPVLVLATIVGSLGLICLLVYPRLEVTVALLGIYLGTMDGPVKLFSGGGNAVSALRNVLIVAVCVGAVVRILATRQRITLPALSPWVFGFVLVVLLQVLNPNTGSLLKVAGGLRQQLEWVPFFFFGYVLIRTKPRLRKLFLLLGLIALANGIVSAYQISLSPHQFASWGPGYAEKVLGLNGVSGTTFSAEGAGRVRPLALGSDIGFGGSVGVIALPGTLALLALARGMRQRWFYLLLSLGAVLSVAVSLSRTAVLGAVVTLVVFALLSFSAGRFVRRPLAAILLILLLAIPMTSVLSSTEGSAVFSRYSSIAGSQAAESSTDYKSVSLKQIPVAIANDPFGFGLGTAGAASSFGGKTTVTLEGHGFSSETQYNFIMNELGLPGLVLWVALTIYLGLLVVGRITSITDPETRVALAAVFSVLAGLTVMGFAGAFMAGQASGPYFWFAIGIAAYWLAGPGRRAAGASDGSAS